ncbi:hypothetical protein HT031_003719 [Scenedesmus sp. PABB004]|nr:hypothetical protein HT031_003719 [Scenedesmus sp. PABB004]
MTQLTRQIAALAALLLATAAAPAAAARSVPPAAVGLSEPVRVELYMEALCPYCANFTLTGLAPLFESKLSNYVQLDVIPWGNARVDADGAVQCQHGPLECALNKLLSCALALEPEQDDWFPFLSCAEDLALKNAKRKPMPEEVAGVCGKHAGMPPGKLIACLKGELGDSLQRLARERTESLQPAHRWVPWLVVNGIPVNDIDSVATYICVALGAHEWPEACKHLPVPEEDTLAPA